MIVAGTEQMGQTRHRRLNTPSSRAMRVAVVLIFILVMLAFLRRRRSHFEVPDVETSGRVEDARVVVDHAFETKGGSEVRWRAEYLVKYRADPDHSVWTDSGIRSDSEAGARLALPKSLPSCRVRYNLFKPELAVANCK